MSTPDDIHDALEHAEDALDLVGIDVKYRVGPLRLRSLEYVLEREDASGWLELDPNDFDGLERSEKVLELSRYRDRAFAERAMRWVDQGVIPQENAVVIVDGAFGTVIGDGRGRVNVAYAFGIDKIWTVSVTLSPATPADRKRWLQRRG